MLCYCNSETNVDCLQDDDYGLIYPGQTIPISLIQIPRSNQVNAAIYSSSTCCLQDPYLLLYKPCPSELEWLQLLYVNCIHPSLIKCIPVFPWKCQSNVMFHLEPHILIIASISIMLILKSAHWVLQLVMDHVIVMSIWKLLSQAWDVIYKLKHLVVLVKVGLGYLMIKNI